MFEQNSLARKKCQQFFKIQEGMRRC